MYEMMLFRGKQLFSRKASNSAKAVVSGILATMLLFISDVGYSQYLTNYVQPLLGTAPSATPSALKHSESGSEAYANTIPSVTRPFAMTQWTPQTRTGEKKCVAPYYYNDSILTGFRGTHWLSGSCTQDYGSVTVMPVVGKLKITPEDYSVPFTHQNEISSPVKYQLEAGFVITRMASTLRCGMIQFTIQKNDSLNILIIPNSDYGGGFVRLNSNTGEIWGYNPVHRIYQGWGEPAGFNGWFYMKADSKFFSHGTFAEGKIFDEDSIGSRKSLGAFIGFRLKKGEQITLRIGTSFTSLEGAKRNLLKEIGNKSINEISEDARKEWEKTLARISVETDNETDKRIFYTAFYHSMQQPRLYNDVDGAYPAFAGNKQLEKVSKGNYYDDFSMWDIYRAELPLFEILSPDLINDFVRSLISKSEQGGWLPIFPCWNSYTAAMIGDHATAFIASAFNKGIRDYNVEKIYQYMRQNAFETPAHFEDYKNGKGRRALNSYLFYGYIPLEDTVGESFHKREQVSRTLEYAFDDYGLAMVAKGLQKNDDFNKLRERYFNYRNVFDSTVEMVRGRYEDGAWYQPFRPDKRESYITEGTPRQYTFYIPHNMPDLSNMLGGDKKFITVIDSLFRKNEYWHGNEPSQHIPFLYNYTSEPYKTQEQVRKILSEEYGVGPGGLSGNDDAGQISAWYIFAAMGFYPVDPVSGNYQLTSPIFDDVLIRLQGNRTFEIKTHPATPGAAFIKQVKWNGEDYSKNFISYNMIMAGGRLEIWLTDKPTGWGSSVEARSTGFGN